MKTIVTTFIAIMFAFTFSTFAEKGEGKKLSKEERKAKMEERMKNMSPEQKEKFKQKMAEIREKMKDMSPEERKAFISEMKKKRGKKGKKSSDGEGGGVEPERP